MLHVNASVRLKINNLISKLLMFPVCGSNSDKAAAFFVLFFAPFFYWFHKLIKSGVTSSAITHVMLQHAHSEEDVT